MKENPLVGEIEYHAWATGQRVELWFCIISVFVIQSK